MQSKIKIVTALGLLLVVVIIYFLNQNGNKETITVATAVKENRVTTTSSDGSPVCTSDSPDSLLKANYYSDGSYYSSKDCKLLYTSSTDKPNESLCDQECAKIWIPYFSTELQPENSSDGLTNTLTVITRSDGTKQYALGGKPLYTYVNEKRIEDRFGIGLVPGWEPIKLK